MTTAACPSNLETAFHTLKRATREGGFTSAEAEAALGKSKRRVSLLLHRMVERGWLARSGRGVYTFCPKPAAVVRARALPASGRELHEALRASGA